MVEDFVGEEAPKFEFCGGIGEMQAGGSVSKGQLHGNMVYYLPSRPHALFNFSFQSLAAHCLAGCTGCTPFIHSYVLACAYTYSSFIYRYNNILFAICLERKNI